MSRKTHGNAAIDADVKRGRKRREREDAKRECATDAAERETEAAESVRQIGEAP